VGSDGLIKTATTNLLLQSEEFDNASWDSAAGARSVSSNSQVAPNGIQVADTVTADGTTASHFVSQSATLSATPYSFSVFAKAGTNNFIQLRTFNAFGGMFANFDLSTGVVGATGAASGATPTSLIQPYLNGWFRCTMVFTPAAASSSVGIYLVDSASAPGSQSNSLSTSVHLWGAQLEQSSTVGEYVKTTSTINSVPRFDHDPTTGESLGLLVEESRTNLLPSSEDVDYAGYQRSAITTSLNVATVTAPDGTTTADEIAPTATTGEHFIGYTTPANVISGTTYTFSAYVKPNGTDSVRIRFAFAGFNNENGSHVFSTNTTTSGNCDFRIAPVANGWYRIQGTVVASSTAVGQPRIYPNQSNSWLGVPSEALYVWGAQLEVGSFPTSYIPTEGSTVTRAADVASISGSNFSSWYNQSEGTTYYEAVQPLQFIPFQAIATFTASTIVDEWRIWRSNTNTAASTATVSSSISLSATINYFAAPNGGYAFAGAMKTDDAICAANGILSNADTSGQFPSFQSLRLGARSNNTFYWNGHISRLTYWPQRLPDSTLQTITQ